MWNQRNICVFDKVDPSWGEVKELIKTRVAFWVRGKDGWKDYSVEDFQFSSKAFWFL